MLIRITNKCTMQCSHCMIDASSPKGEHMTMDIFDKALELSYIIGTRFILLSGGEPFEHPDVFEMIAKTLNRGFITMVCTNGLFALDPEVRNRVAHCGALIQVTNDPRYYPRNLHLVGHLFRENNWSFEDHIQTIHPCRRTKENGIATSRRSPMCFNLRSATRTYDLLSAMVLLQSMGKLCSPSINVDGSVRAGEADTCYKIGNVDSDEAYIDQAIRTMKCNKCGLQDNLGQMHLEAIGAI